MLIELMKQYAASYESRKREIIEGMQKFGWKEKDIYVDRQIIQKPKELPNFIPTLQTDFNRPLSPMLKERFAFADNWKDCDTEFLGHEKINKTLRTKYFRRWIDVMRRNWEGSAPQLYPDNQISLFAIEDRENGDYVLLVWVTPDAIEPQIWCYTGQSEQIFENLAQYFLWLVEE